MNLQEWISKKERQSEKLVITDNVQNINVLIRKINASGTPVCNLSVKRIVDIAKDILITNASNSGELRQVETISNEIGAFLIQSIIEKDPQIYSFVPKESICYRTAYEILDNVNLIRENFLTDSFDKVSISKTGQLWHLAVAYEDAMAAANVYDSSRLLKEATRLLQEGKVLRCKFNCALLFFNKLNCLEDEFLSAYTTQADVLSYDIPQQRNVNWTFFRAYGVFNEVEHVISDIIKNKIPLGQVALIYTASEYESYIAGSCAQQDISVRFVSGRSARGFNYVRVLQAILTWAGNNYSYESLKPLFFNPLVRITGKNRTEDNYMRAFIQGINTGIGWGLLRYRHYFKNKNDIETDGNSDSDTYHAFLAILDRLSSLFYSFERETKRGGINLSEMLRALLEFADSITVPRNPEMKYIKAFLNQEIKGLKYRNPAASVSEAVQILAEDIDRIQAREKEKPDAIQAVRAGGFQIIERPYVYVIGLSDKQYRQAVAESPVLSDKERERYFDLTKGNVILAKNWPAKRQKDFIQMLESLQTGRINIGYCGFDTIKQELCSPSTLYLNLLEEQHYRRDDIRNTEYDNIIEENIQVDDTTLWPEEMKKENEKSKAKNEITKSVSVSALDTLFTCPLQYHYSRELKIPGEEYQEALVDAWLSPVERGNFVHRVLQEYVSKYFKGQKAVSPAINLTDFESIFDRVLTEYKEKCPSVSDSVVKMEIDKVKIPVLTYLADLHKEFSQPDCKWHVEDCEVTFPEKDETPLTVEYILEGGKKLQLQYKGIIDRVDSYTDENENKHYRLIDYKTGNKDDFEEQKLNVTTQHHIYCMHIKQYGQVDEFKYVFLLAVEYEQKEITVHYFSDPVQAGTGRKEKLKEVLFEQVYSDTKPEKACDYCSYADICYYKKG